MLERLLTAEPLKSQIAPISKLADVNGG